MHLIILHFRPSVFEASLYNNQFPILIGDVPSFINSVAPDSNVIAGFDDIIFVLNNGFHCTDIHADCLAESGFKPFIIINFSRMILLEHFRVCWKKYAHVVKIPERLSSIRIP